MAQPLDPVDARCPCSLPRTPRFFWRDSRVGALASGQGREQRHDVAGRKGSVGLRVLAVDENDAGHRGGDPERCDHAPNAGRFGDVKGGATRLAARGKELGERGEEADLDGHLTLACRSRDRRVSATRKRSPGRI